MSLLVRAYKAAVPGRVRRPLWQLRTWAGAMATSREARRDWLARGLITARRPVRAVRVPHGRLWVDLRDIGVGRKIFVHGAMRRHRNQASGSAIATASAAEQTASVSEWISAARHSGSVKICAYQESENPFGGKVRSCFSLTETPATTISGAARNSATVRK